MKLTVLKYFFESQISILLQSLNLMQKENRSKNQRKNLSTFNCDKIGNHLLSSINNINKKSKGDYLLAIIQDKTDKYGNVIKVLDLPGGCRDLGEDSDETVIRELEEETGIKKKEVKILEKFVLKETFRLYTAIYQKPNDSEEPKDNENQNIFNINNINYNQDEIEIEV